MYGYNSSIYRVVVSPIHNDIYPLQGVTNPIICLYLYLNMEYNII